MIENADIFRSMRGSIVSCIQILHRGAGYFRSIDCLFIGTVNQRTVVNIRCIRIISVGIITEHDIILIVRGAVWNHDRESGRAGIRTLEFIIRVQRYIKRCDRIIAAVTEPDHQFAVLGGVCPQTGMRSGI